MSYRGQKDRIQARRDLKQSAPPEQPRNKKGLIQKWAVGHTRCSRGSASILKLTLAVTGYRTGHDRIGRTRQGSSLQPTIKLNYCQARHPGKVGRQWYRAKAKSSARPP
ncbi:unnamed protein product [Fusarium venenatum]|uniref:Uncharacterized protein n=1 Tax=Fusarium venenatum TaxID=56646 RepID=A0A2L2TD20_9HYPO|nr:uncharacterized protein FVRRES_08949 [Fusarium venenatum]CEI68872.1 unnamed protein product [Fusarium venenatum]